MLESKVSACKELREYINLATYHIECAYTSNLQFIVQTDLNPLNVLWDSSQCVKGIVDFESIGYVDRIEGLAFLIKWYFREQKEYSLMKYAQVLLVHFRRVYST